MTKPYEVPAWARWVAAGCGALVILTFIFVVFVMPPEPKKSPDISSLITKAGYNAGFEAGKEDREKGFKPEPDVVYNQPLFRAVIDKYIDAAVQPFGGKGRDVVEDLFKNAFMRGYAAGYY